MQREQRNLICMVVRNFRSNIFEFDLVSSTLHNFFSVLQKKSTSSFHAYRAETSVDLQNIHLSFFRANIRNPLHFRPKRKKIENKPVLKTKAKVSASAPIFSK